MTETRRIFKASWRVLKEEGALTLARYSLEKLYRREFHIVEHKISEETLSRNLKILQDGADDKFPIPPISLVELVTGSFSLDWFLRSGKMTVTNIENLLVQNSLKLSDFNTILDFGCGCGRVIRHLNIVKRLCGCDSNPEAIEWAKDNLNFAEFSVNRQEPPNIYGDSEFDLVLALSVLTHMTEELGHRWMAEFHRLVRPDGFLILSLHGEATLQPLTPKERRRFLDGQVVVRGERYIGSNRCAAFHPSTYVREELERIPSRRFFHASRST